jgi:lipid II:glycine glycyltransferase (peptidoglycan interpeptide bridge formation enzyme)
MYCKVEPKQPEEMSSCNIVQQTSFWAEVKRQQGIEPVAFDYHATGDLLHPGWSPDRHTTGDLLVLVRNIDHDRSIAYVPYGPTDEPEFENQGLFLEELSEVLRPQLPSSCILIRYDLPWENQWANEEDRYDEAGNWLGAPEINSQEFRVNFNTQNWNLLKSRSDILPTNTIFLNLKNSREAMLQQMKPKTRYNIRLAFRKGVRVKSYGPEYLETWYDLYRETALRNGVTLHSREYFRTVLKSYQHDDSGDVDVRLLMADHEGDFLAAMFLVVSGRRATYLYGASSSRKRNLMATYAIQWEAIRLASEAGCREYDMFGVAPNAYRSHPMHGLYRFKSGFGGEIYHRMGCWDYPLERSEYNMYMAQEVNSQKYHVH